MSSGPDGVHSRGAIPLALAWVVPLGVERSPEWFSPPS
jgi:hypothetical protein